MKVLMLSLDGSILDKYSISTGRMKEYGSICDELHIVVVGKGGEAVRLGENIFVYPTSPKRIQALIQALIQAKKILNKTDRWVITTQDPFEAGFIGWLLAKKFKYGLEVQLHGDFYGNAYWRRERLLNQFRYFLGKFVLKNAKNVRVVSERIRESIRKINSNIRVVPIFTSLHCEPDKIPDKENSEHYPTILSVGNLVPVKNHKQLIKVFKDIKREFPKAKLFIVGKGPLKKSLQLTAYNLQLGDSVEFPGQHDSLDDFYKRADILVHPSLYEGWGRVLIEAAHFDLPIVMTDVGLAGEVIKNEESGLVVSVNDKKALKEAILRLAKDEDLQKRLAENAKIAVEQKISTKQEYLAKIKLSWQTSLI